MNQMWMIILPIRRDYNHGSTAFTNHQDGIALYQATFYHEVRAADRESFEPAHTLVGPVIRDAL